MPAPSLEPRDVQDCGKFRRRLAPANRGTGAGRLLSISLFHEPVRLEKTGTHFTIVPACVALEALLFRLAEAGPVIAVVPA